jgi:methionyl aminopeptidase
MDKIEAMVIGGRKLVKILNKLETMAKPGTNLLTIEKKANDLILKEGGQPSFKMVQDYSNATCLNVNDGLVHGIPRNYSLKEGDVLNIDIGMLYQGFHTDLAKSMIVSSNPGKYPEKEQFLLAGKEALSQAIGKARPGNFVGDISQTIEEVIEEAGYRCSRIYTGHGISTHLHEQPFIPCVLMMKPKKTPVLKDKMTVAIEIIYMIGTDQSRIDSDGWTVRTSNGNLGACFEKTIAVGRKPIILTDWQ